MCTCSDLRKQWTFTWLVCCHLVFQSLSEEATATATTVVKPVAKDVLYFNAWWHRNLAIALATSGVAVSWGSSPAIFISLCAGRKQAWPRHVADSSRCTSYLWREQKWTRLKFLTIVCRDFVNIHITLQISLFHLYKLELLTNEQVQVGVWVDQTIVAFIPYVLLVGKQFTTPRSVFLRHYLNLTCK